jgi:hypothetical protein
VKVTDNGSPALSDEETITVTVNEVNEDVSRIIDDGDPGFRYHNGKKDPWKYLKAGYEGDSRYNSRGTGKSYATWTLTDVPRGIYELYATWVPGKNRATNALYKIWDGGTEGGFVDMNQRRTPNGPTEFARPWQLLGTFGIASGTARVTLSDKANGVVVADAIRLKKSTFGFTAAELRSAVVAALSYGSAAGLPQPQAGAFAEAHVAVTERSNASSGIAFPVSSRGDRDASSYEGAHRDVSEPALLALVSEPTSKARSVTRLGHRMEDGRFNDSESQTTGKATLDQRVRNWVFGGLENDWLLEFPSG